MATDPASIVAEHARCIADAQKYAVWRQKWPKAHVACDALLSPYTGLTLECDGYSRVVTYVLTEAAIPHIVRIGSLTDTTRLITVAPHLWVEVGRLRIDFAARLWLGDGPTIPHGVFAPDEYLHLRYDGKPIALAVSPIIFEVLVETGRA